jgi:hypothetical protein
LAQAGLCCIGSGRVLEDRGFGCLAGLLAIAMLGLLALFFYLPASR